jgi:iron complex transport system substrate-binding protein
MSARQRSRPVFFVFLAGCAAFLALAGCDRRDATPAKTDTSATSPANRPTVASLSPAATDLLIGMDFGEHLIAVSNWDAENPHTKNLPRVGDYRAVDRERLTALHPDVIVVQFRPDKIPPGLEEFAGEIHAKLVNIQIVVLDDIYTTITRFGEALGSQEQATATVAKLKAELDSVRRSVAGHAPVRVYVARSDNGLDSVGGGNFVDDLLTIAGGTNVLTGGHNSFPTIDREQLVKLDPDVILHLLPVASPQVVDQAKRFWAAMPELKAVKANRVYVLEDYYVLQPSDRIGDAAKKFAECLHGKAP